MEKHTGSRFAHATKAHPCFSEKMHDAVGRVHIPIAPKCNIYCNFCTRDINQDETGPKEASCAMSVDEATKHVENAINKGSISVVGVSGPGDSLANESTFEFFKKLTKTNPNLFRCMTTNGLLLPDYAEKLAELGINTVTVTVNAIDPEIAKDIYTFINFKGKIYKGIEAAEILIKNQIEGIEKLANLGVFIKVNSVLIPGLNDEHIVEIAKEVKKRGASLMNVLPLEPQNKMKDYHKPTCAQIGEVRDKVEAVFPVFRSCSQCKKKYFYEKRKSNYS